MTQLKINWKYNKTEKRKKKEDEIMEEHGNRRTIENIRNWCRHVS